MTDVIRIQKLNHSKLILDCDRSIAAELSDYFCFYVPGYQFIPSYKNKMWDGKMRLFDSRSKTIASGLYKYILEFADTPGRDYKIVPVESEKYGMPYETNDIDMSFMDSYTYTSKGKAIVPHDYQVKAIEHGLRNKQSLILSPTASGKSFIIYNYMRHHLDNYDSDVLLVVPTTSLVNQMYTDFSDYSEFDETFDTEDICQMIYSGKPKDVPGKRVVVTTWQSIFRLGPEWFKRFGMVIGDEAHGFKAKSLMSILDKCSEAKYRFGTTGTLDGTKTHALQLQGGFGPIYKVITTKELMDAGHISGLKINVLLLNYPDADKKIISKLKYQDEISYIVGHEARNNFIRNLALSQSGNTLVLFQLVDKHGIPLYNIIKEAAGGKRKVFFVSGKTDADIREDVRRLTEKETDAVIVASMGTFATGINIKNLHNIIFGSPSKSQIKVLQAIGRGLRISDNGADATLFDIADDLSWKKKKNYTLKHAGERIKIYSKEKFDYKVHGINIG